MERQSAAADGPRASAGAGACTSRPLQGALFPASPSPRVPASIPTGRDYLAAGLTPRQGFARRYPVAGRLRGMAIIDLVASGLATPAMRAEWDAWYREHWGPPVEVTV